MWVILLTGGAAARDRGHRRDEDIRPGDSVARAGRQVVEISLDSPAVLAAAGRCLAQRLPQAAGARTDSATGRLTIPAPDGLATLLAAAEALRAAGIAVASVNLSQPSLDDAFVALTAPEVVI